MKQAVCIVAAIVVFVAAGLPAKAQDQSKQALAEEMLNQVNMKQRLEETSAMLKQVLVAQLQKVNPAPKDPAAQAKVASFVEKILDMVKSEASWEKRKDEYITLYAEAFTEPELKGIIEFYKTPSGQALIKKQPELVKRSVQLSQKMIMELLPKIQAMSKEMTDELKKDTSPQSPATPQGK